MIAGNEPLIGKIREVVVYTDEAVEATKTNAAIGDLAQAGEQAIGAMRKLRIGRIRADLTVRGAGAALSS